MPTAGPYGITQFDAAGVIGNYQAAKENRIRSLILEKQMAALDKQEKAQSGIQKAVSAYYGGETSPVPDATGTPGAPGASAAAPTVPTTAQPSAVPAPSRQPSAADREHLIGTLMAIDAPTAEKYIDLFSKMDKAQVDHFNQNNGQIMQIMGSLTQLPAANRKAAIQQSAPELQKLGYTPEQLANFDPSDENLRSEMARHMDASKVAEFVKPDLMTVAPGNSVIDKKHPEQGASYTAPTDYHTFMVHNADGTDTPYGFDPKTGRAFQLREGSAEGGGEQVGATDPDTLFSALIQQESGGHPGVTGPPTKYGRSTGLTQLLPATGKEMAEKLGVPWRPGLLTGTSPEATEYQRKLGRAYFDQGMEKYPGDTRKALMYYHGGPDQKLWGPKTHAYADSILKRVGKGVEQSGAGAPISGKPLPADASSDETAQFIGGQVALGQPMPPLGMGKEAAAMRRAILAEATKQWKMMGISPGEANVIAAQNKSGLAELAKIAQIKANVLTAENTATANATQVLSLLGSAGTTGSPVFNQWQQAGRRATGNAKVSAFDVAVKTLATEYARVMSGGGNSPLSDSARHEADALIHTSMTPDQFRSAINQLKIDMANRTKGIEQERQATLQQIKTGGKSPDEGWITLPSGLKIRKVQ
jgi:hypothetical protein